MDGKEAESVVCYLLFDWKRASLFAFPLSVGFGRFFVDRNVLKDLLCAFARAEGMEEMRKIVDYYKLVDEKLLELVFTTFVRQRRLDLAHKLLDEAFGANSDLCIRCAERLIETYSVVANYQMSLALFTKCFFSSEKKYGVRLFNALLLCSTQHGCTNFFKKDLNWLKRNGLKPDTKTFELLMQVHKNAGEYDDAVRLFERYLGSGKVPTVALLNLLRECALAMRSPNALKLWFDNVRQHNDHPPPTRYFTACLSAMAEIGEYKHVARLSMDQLVSLARNLLQHQVKPSREIVNFMEDFSSKHSSPPAVIRHDLIPSLDNLNTRHPTGDRAVMI